MNEITIFPPAQHDLLASLAAHLRSYGSSGWIVGGTVRDILLGKFNADLDVAIVGDAVELARSFADATGGAWVLLDQQFGSARVVWPEANPRGWPRVLDLVRLRAATIEQDLGLRDFTINALALALEDVGQAASARLIDPLGGAEDLRQGRLRATGPRSLVDDPLRMLRAVRLAAALNYVCQTSLLRRSRHGARRSWRYPPSAFETNCSSCSRCRMPGHGFAFWIRLGYSRR